MKSEIKEKIKTVLLTVVAYFRMLAVIFSVFANIEREWFALLLSWIIFGTTTWLIGFVISSPDKEDIQNLTAILTVMTNVDKKDLLEAYRKMESEEERSL